jgi:N4-gp56 family major capsid protein
MAVNTSSQYQADVVRILAHDTLEVAQRFLVLSQFADKKTMDHDHGTSWTATRFNRLPLPVAPLSEGVPPIGQTLTISQVTGVAIQWGDKVTFTDVSTITIQHDLLHEATERLGMQIAEMRERNVWNAVLAGTQVNYVNTRGSRGALLAGDILDVTTVSRTVANLKKLGAPMWSGQTGETVQRSIDHNARGSSGKPMTHEHYVAVTDPLVTNDLASNAAVVQAWSYSDVTRLYINELGYWRGLHICESNMTPTWTGVTPAIAGTGVGTGGNLPAGTYIVQVTGWDIQNFYESRIYAATTAITVGGSGAGSITLTTPPTPNFTYAVYISSTNGTFVSFLATTSSVAAPQSGPYTGQAIMLPPSTAVTLTGIGLYQIPPAAPANGITVFPVAVFGQRAFAGLKLENISWTRLFEADKSDPNNQLRVIGWKLMEGWVILNQTFLARIECTASNNGTFG